MKAQLEQEEHINERSKFSHYQVFPQIQSELPNESNSNQSEINSFSILVSQPSLLPQLEHDFQIKNLSTESNYNNIQEEVQLKDTSKPSQRDSVSQPQYQDIQHNNENFQAEQQSLIEEQKTELNRPDQTALSAIKARQKSEKNIAESSDEQSKFRQSKKIESYSSFKQVLMPRQQLAVTQQAKIQYINMNDISKPARLVGAIGMPVLQKQPVDNSAASNLKAVASTKEGTDQSLVKNSVSDVVDKPNPGESNASNISPDLRDYPSPGF
ncbi:hypothetical protein FGO68_gene8060 [Halteria grandinella]|uniref:Uncharacterized protein n=1 Tax=Halteria grandinella TaxID=5974 RepID=A0A8J8NXB3_HALGN|nr:hypothetical protein FGO68_gene8060 [Halteria grandinella]